MRLTDGWMVRENSHR